MLLKLGVRGKAEVFNHDRIATMVADDRSFANRYAAVRQAWEIDPASYLYMRPRMVSAWEQHGPNANGDAFRARELARRYATFINDPVNIDHDNDDITKAVGFIVDARWLPDGHYVEGIHAIDRDLADKKHPGIIAGLESGKVTDTSMGCFVEHSICSRCLVEAGWDGITGNDIDKYAAKLSLGKGIATVPDEYCHHIGRYGEKKGGKTGAFEFNCNVTFFEDSIITTTGADDQAKYLERLAAKGIDWRRYLVNRFDTSHNIGGGKMAKQRTAEELRMDTIN